jgi:hypothetical protein
MCPTRTPRTYSFISIAELYAIRDAESLEVLHRRIQAVLYRWTFEPVPLELLIELAESSHDPDVVRAGRFARAAMERLTDDHK